MKFAEGDKVVTDSIDIVTKRVGKYMIKSGRKLCTAESCTGGMISQTITSVSGASEMFLGGACTYTEVNFPLRLPTVILRLWTFLKKRI